MDVVADMKAVEAQIGGRVGDAIAGAKTRTATLGDKVGGLFGKAKSSVTGLGKPAMVAIAITVCLLLEAALASPIALWSAYHSGKDRQAAIDNAADARAVAHQAEIDKATAARESVRLAKVDAADKTEIARLKKISVKLPPKTRFCPPAVYDVIHGLGGYTLVPPKTENLP